MSKRTREAKKLAATTGAVVTATKVTTPAPKPVPTPTKVIDTAKLPADPKNREVEIKGLLSELETETDANEKKRIRRSLRAKGHFGGTRTKDKLIVSKEEATKKAAPATK